MALHHVRDTGQRSSRMRRAVGCCCSEAATAGARSPTCGCCRPPCPRLQLRRPLPQCDHRSRLTRPDRP